MNQKDPEALNPPREVGGRLWAVRLGGQGREGRWARLAAGRGPYTRAEEAVGGLGGRDAACSVGETGTARSARVARVELPAPALESARGDRGHRIHALHFPAPARNSPREGTRLQARTEAFDGNWARGADGAGEAAVGAGHRARFGCSAGLDSVSAPSAQWQRGPGPWPPAGRGLLWPACCREACSDPDDGQIPYACASEKRFRPGQP